MSALASMSSPSGLFAGRLSARTSQRWVPLCWDIFGQPVTIENHRARNARLDSWICRRFRRARRVLVVEGVLAGRDFFGERLAQQIECGRPQCVLVSSVVDAAHAAFAGEP